MVPSNVKPDSSTVKTVENEAPRENVVEEAESNYERTVQHCQAFYVSEFERRDVERRKYAQITAQAKLAVIELKAYTELHLTATSISNKNLQERVLNLEAKERKLQEKVGKLETWSSCGLNKSPEEIGELMATVQELRDLRDRYHQGNGR